MSVKTELYIPRFTANDESVKIIEWLVEDGDYIACGQKILLVETSKTSIEIESELSGYIVQKSCLNDIVSVGTCYACIFNSVEELKTYQFKIESDIAHEESVIVDEKNPTFSNAALKFINEHGINSADFSDLEFVTIEKIKEKLSENKKELAFVSKAHFPNASIETLPFCKLSEINNLKKNQDDVIASSLSVQFNSEVIRNKVSAIPWLNKRILPYILFVFSKQLSLNPRFTSFFVDEKICLYNCVNIGLAIDLGKGLKVVVINDVDKLNLFDLQMRIIDLISHYHEDTLTLPMLQNSTVTVTDLSQDNILTFQPVLHANQAIILGVGGDHNLLGAPITLTIVFDHRVLTGQEVARFLNEFKQKLFAELEYL